MTASADGKINNGGDAGTGNPVDNHGGEWEGGRVDNHVANRGGSGAGNVVALRPGLEPGSVAAAAEAALAAFGAHLDRCALAANTVTAYRRQAIAYRDWLLTRAAEHADAFVDLVGAEAAVTAWRRHLLAAGASPATVNQALAAVTLLYEHGPSLRLAVKRARVPKPGAPDALSRAQENAVRRAADRRGPRDAALIALLLGAGARAEECQRLRTGDIPFTARSGTARLHGKGDEVRTVPLPVPARERLTAWLQARAELLAARPNLAEQVGDGLWVGQDGCRSTASPTWSAPSARTRACRPCARTGCATPTPPGCAKPAPITPRSKPSSATPPSKPPPATSVPPPPKSPISSTAPSTTDTSSRR
ncbi:hypothetical protein GCM10017559_02560 [Streptosporangium longisporum]|uniref:Integrase n=1 Tax=Streptosporangium longisporum TaxID=46187 RepID=A0ABN3XPV2_9ACTN